jgi:uncharacterized protein
MSAFSVVSLVVSVLLAGYVAVALAVMLLQRRLIYRPDPRRAVPADFGLADRAEVVAIPTADGAVLVAWYAPAAIGHKTILYFHGNKGLVELRGERMADLTARGFGVLMTSYRGYGGSTGTASEAANVADARLAYDWLRAQGVASDGIVLFGESLGSGVATQLAGAKIASGLILDCPYTSLTDLAAADYPWLPVRRLMWDHYETVRHIKRVTIPVLVLHGAQDDLVPVAMGRAVHAAAVSPAQLAIFEDAGHLHHLKYGSFDLVQRWIDGLPTCSAPTNDVDSSLPEMPGIEKARHEAELPNRQLSPM